VLGRRERSEQLICVLCAAKKLGVWVWSLEIALTPKNPIAEQNRACYRGLKQLVACATPCTLRQTKSTGFGEMMPHAAVMPADATAQRSNKKKAPGAPLGSRALICTGPHV
jgi:hypothetical protein